MNVKHTSISKVNLYLIGFGVVGRSLAKILPRHPYLKIVAVSDSQGSAYCEDGLDPSRLLKVKISKGSVRYYSDHVGIINPLELIGELYNIDIVVLMTPTNLEDGQPDISYIKKTLECGKHVVTSNKGPMALAFWELMDLTKKYDRQLRYEACVGSSLPVIGMCEYLKPSQVTSVMGILNGTTNFILTEMEKEKSYEDSLRKAQEVGIAEADPTLDVDGYDAATKLVIMANTLGRNLNFHHLKQDGKIKGISGITIGDIKRARENRKVIKLIARLSDSYEGIAPEELPEGSDLAQVDGTYNAVKFSTNLIGDLFLKGKGAGGFETAHAIINDIIEIGRSEKWIE